MAASLMQTLIRIHPDPYPNSDTAERESAEAVAAAQAKARQAERLLIDFDRWTDASYNCSQSFC